MPSPTVLLFILIGMLGMFGSGVSIGYKWSERSHAADVATAANKAIDDANTAVDLAIERTLASAKKETAARLAARDIRHKGELDAAKKSRPECSRDAESLGLLNDAISTANSETPATGKLPDSVRPATKPDGWFGAIGEKLGISADRNSGAVSPDTRGLRGVGE